MEKYITQVVSTGCGAVPSCSTKKIHGSKNNKKKKKKKKKKKNFNIIKEKVHPLAVPSARRSFLAWQSATAPTRI